MQIKGAMLASLVAFGLIALVRGLSSTSSEAEIAEFHKQFPNKDACLGATAERMALCTSPGCEQLVFARMQQCLDQARGDKEEFCESVTIWFEDSQGRDIFDTHCSPHTSFESECEKLIAHVGGYCSRIN